MQLNLYYWGIAGIQNATSVNTLEQYAKQRGFIDSSWDIIGTKIASSQTFPIDFQNYFTVFIIYWYAIYFQR